MNPVAYRAYTLSSQARLVAIVSYVSSSTAADLSWTRNVGFHALAVFLGKGDALKCQNGHI